MPNKISKSKYRVLLLDYKNPHVSAEIPNLFKISGCEVDVFCNSNSWLRKNLKHNHWYPAPIDSKKYI